MLNGLAGSFHDCGSEPPSASLAFPNDPSRLGRIPTLSIEPLDEEALIRRNDDIGAGCHDAGAPLAILEHVAHHNLVAFGHADHSLNVGAIPPVVSPISASGGA